jgi:predicted SAM-dependent methyltransferase
MLNLDFSSTRLSWDRSIFSYTKVQGLISALIRNRRHFARLKRDAYLNIGCGPHIHDGYCNLDYSWRPGVDVCWDVTRSLPMSDSSVRGIYTEHCIEHLEFCAVFDLLKECYRVLANESYIRIIVPDAAIYIREYVKHIGGDKVAMPYREDDTQNGIYTPIMSINRIFYSHGHRFIYDFETLKIMLERSGFSQVAKLSFGVGSDKMLLLDTPFREVESLYVEAKKSD